MALLGVLCQWVYCANLYCAKLGAIVCTAIAMALPLFNKFDSVVREKFWCKYVTLESNPQGYHSA